MEIHLSKWVLTQVIDSFPEPVFYAQHHSELIITTQASSVSASVDECDAFMRFPSLYVFTSVPFRVFIWI